MPAHSYEYNGRTIDLPFSVGDTVTRDGETGTIVTVNHDDLAHIIYLVKFSTGTVWVGADLLS